MRESSGVRESDDHEQPGHRKASARVAPTANSPAGTSTASLASVAYATDDSASDDSTASPVTLVSRSCGACEVGSGMPRRVRFSRWNTRQYQTGAIANAMEG